MRSLSKQPSLRLPCCGTGRKEKEDQQSTSRGAGLSGGGHSMCRGPGTRKEGVGLRGACKARATAFPPRAVGRHWRLWTSVWHALHGAGQRGHISSPSGGKTVSEEGASGCCPETKQRSQTLNFFLSRACSEPGLSWRRVAEVLTRYSLPTPSQWGTWLYPRSNGEPWKVCSTSKGAAGAGQALGGCR